MATLRFVKKPKPKRKPGQRAGMTRAKIALAAAAQLEKDGPNAFSLRKLAKSLGVVLTTVSSHFKGGLEEIEEEIVQTLLADVAPPFEPKQEPKEYVETMVFSTLEALTGRPVIAMLTIQCLSKDPLLVPKMAERTLASLAALGVKSPNIPAAFRTTLQTLLALILQGPARSFPAAVGKGGKAAYPAPSLPESEFPNVSKFRSAILDDLTLSASWTPELQPVKVAIERLTQELGVG